VAFESAASNLTGDADGNREQDVFVRDLSGGLGELASHRSPFFPRETLSSADVQSLEDVTPDGRFVLFATNAVDLTTAVQTPQTNYIYLRDRQTGLTEVASVLPGGITAGESLAPARLSADGR